MTYEEKLLLLDGEDFFTLFFKFQAEPRWVTSAGKRAIQVLGKCHHGENHSALFDPSTLKVNCFSLCGRGMHLHTWFKQALNLDDPQDAKEFIESWIDNQNIDFTNRVSSVDFNFDYEERVYVPKLIEKVPGIEKDKLDKYLSRFDNSLSTLNNLVWHTEDGISPEVLKLYDVSYYPDRETIILPHHNIDGEIVGLYERSFRELRKVVRERYPDMPFKTDLLMKSRKGKMTRQVQLIDYPRAKYVPLLRDEDDRTPEKTSWSFPNSQNLYGLHLAKEEIKNKKVAIIFEGGKSVMLAHQFGYKYTVATHTFGAHPDHISMLIECGAEEIILAFDKQYKNHLDKDWDLYEKKTRILAEKVGKYVTVSRIIDGVEEYLDFKDSPIDKGKEIFEKLLSKREFLTGKNKAESKPEEKKTGFSVIGERIRDDFNQNNILKDEKYYAALAAKAKRIIQERKEREENGN